MRGAGPSGALLYPHRRPYEGHVLDPDGTILQGEDLLPRAKRSIEKPRERVEIVPLSNSSIGKSTALNLARQRAGVFDTAVTPARWHLRYCPERTVFTDPEGLFERSRREAGIGVSEIVRDRMRIPPSTGLPRS